MKQSWILVTTAPMNALTAKAVEDQSRHQQASRHEQNWQHAYGHLQSNRPSATPTGDGAFAEVVRQAQSMAKQNKLQAAQQQSSSQVTLAAGQKKGFQPGIAPTTRGAETRTLLMRLPSEGQASSLHVPSATPTWYGDDARSEPAPEAKSSSKSKSAPQKQGARYSTAERLDGKLERGASSLAVHKQTKSRTCVVC